MHGEMGRTKRDAGSQSGAASGACTRTASDAGGRELCEPNLSREFWSAEGAGKSAELAENSMARGREHGWKERREKKWSRDAPWLGSLTTAGLGELRRAADGRRRKQGAAGASAVDGGGELDRDTIGSAHGEQE